jgi:ADP-heptose:LPS heptosyltransferase
MVFFNTRRHIAEIYGQMLAAIAGPPSPGIHGVVRARPADRDECESRVRDLGCATRPLVLINVNASELMFERRWPTDRWAHYLTVATARYPDYAWLLIGTSEEREYVAAVVAALPPDAGPRVHNVAGTMSLGALIALLERATMLVTSDTGPLHLAVACGCPTVSLWGPNVPGHYAPTSGRHEVVYSQTYCSPCLYHADFPPCEGDNVCMKRLPVETVLRATGRLVERIATGPVAAGTARSDADVHEWHEDLRHVSPVIFHGPQ